MENMLLGRRPLKYLLVDEYISVSVSTLQCCWTENCNYDLGKKRFSIHSIPSHTACVMLAATCPTVL
jgi:hypothetical protein